jgi:hypothetical protein
LVGKKTNNAINKSKTYPILIVRLTECGGWCGVTDREGCGVV